jgi:serine/threonine protein kinase
MPAPASNDEFLDLVRRSQTVDEEKLSEYLAQQKANGTMPAGPEALANQMIQDGLLTPFQTKQLLQGRWKRFRIGNKYKLLEMLGAGGMGAVYLCEHLFMRRLVALKVLPTDKATDQSAVERFLREARASAALDDHNIVRSYDVDQYDNLYFLVMEYIEGTNLQEIVSRCGRLDPIRAAHYIHGSACGLQHAHEAGLVHRDIKPGNLLLDRQGYVKLLDMGLARFFGNKKDSVTEKYDEKGVLGTADYLAPEQAMHSNVDIRADVYSLGATFYFLLTGQAPFQEGTVAQKLIWHQMREPRPISEFRDDVPNELLDVIRKMMTKDPARRYQTPAEVAEALTPWRDIPIPPPPEEEMPKLCPAIRALSRSTDPAGNESSAAHHSASPARGSAAVARVPATLNRGGINSGSVAVSSGVMSRTRVTGTAETVPLTNGTRPDADGPTFELVEGVNWSGDASAEQPAARHWGPRQTLIAVIVGAVSVLTLIAIISVVLLWNRNKANPVVPVVPTNNAPNPNQPSDPSGPLAPEEAKYHANKRRSVVFKVVQVNDSTGAFYLNSRLNHKDEQNFTVFIKPALAKLIQEQAKQDLVSYFKNRKIKVDGIIQFNAKMGWNIAPDSIGQIVTLNEE